MSSQRYERVSRRLRFAPFWGMSPAPATTVLMRGAYRSQRKTLMNMRLHHILPRHPRIDPGLAAAEPLKTAGIRPSSSAIWTKHSTHRRMTKAKMRVRAIEGD